MINNKKSMENEILIDPATSLGCDELRIISGYATPSMAAEHIERLIRDQVRVKINLIVGMTSSNGLSEVNHKGFLELARKYENFTCSYIKMDNSPCHSKVYLWLKRGMPEIAYLGSANYTQNAFRGVQREAMSTCDVETAELYIDSFSDEVVRCNDSDVDDYVSILPFEEYRRIIFSNVNGVKYHRVIDSDESVFLPLTKADGTMHGKGAGLNWGQREKRNPNQAYIPIPASIRKSGFFPPRKVHFTVETDDGQSMICVVSQQGDKAIETPFDNSQLGSYFRARLGLNQGSFVTLEDLKRYGRINVEFVKLDCETYFMNFSV